jgi:hypothetical protein
LRLAVEAHGAGDRERQVHVGRERSRQAEAGIRFRFFPQRRGLLFRLAINECGRLLQPAIELQGFHQRADLLNCILIGLRIKGGAVAADIPDQPIIALAVLRGDLGGRPACRLPSDLARFEHRYVLAGSGQQMRRS